MKDKNSTKRSKERRGNKLVHLKFYDHSATENANIHEDKFREPTIIEFFGWLIGETDIEYVVEIVRCTLPGNSNVWHIVKSAVIQMEVLQ